MKEFTVLYPGGVDFFQRFFFIRKHEGGIDFLTRLIAIDITEKGNIPLYLPVFTVSKRAGQLTLWINLSRWQYFVINYDRNGLKVKHIDIRKEMGDEASDM